MNSVLVLAIFALILVLSPLTSAVVTQVRCTTSGIGTCADPLCYATSDGKANYGCGNLTVPLNEILISEKVTVKVRGLYVPLDLVPELDYCTYIRDHARGGLSLNTLFSTIVGSYEAQNPGYYHECPYKGKDFQIKDFSFGVVEKFMGVLVTDYTMSFHFRNSNDNNIITINIVGNAKAPEILGIGTNKGINILAYS